MHPVTPAPAPPHPPAAAKWDHGLRREALVRSVLTEIFQGRLHGGQHLVARDLAGRYGMSPAVLGRVRVLGEVDERFLDGHGPGVGEVSMSVHEALDREVRRLVDEAEARATAIVVVHRRALEALVERIVAEETLEGDEVQEHLRPIADAVAGAPARKVPSRTRARPTA